MKVGIVADTHDNLPKIAECIKILNERKVDFLLHCGDFIAPFALNPFSALKCDWVGVFGNNDGEKKGLLAKSEGKIKTPPYFLKLASKQIALTHEAKDLSAQIIAFGHTHKAQLTSRKNKLFINPGEAGGWLYGKSSFAILDLNTMKSEIIYF